MQDKGNSDKSNFNPSPVHINFTIPLPFLVKSPFRVDFHMLFIYNEDVLSNDNRFQLSTKNNEVMRILHETLDVDYCSYSPVFSIAIYRSN